MVVCNLCQKNFSSVSNLDRHKRTIHSVRNKVDDEYENNVDEEQDEYDDDMGSAVEEDEDMGSAVEEDEDENDIGDSESDTDPTDDSTDEDDEIDIWALIDKCADGLEGDELKEHLIENTARAILKALK